jgi:hypothetical protein
MKKSELLNDSQSVVGCPNKTHMGVHACNNKSQCWEPCGDLGHSEDHVRVSDQVIPTQKILKD